MTVVCYDYEVSNSQRQESKNPHISIGSIARIYSKAQTPFALIDRGFVVQQAVGQIRKQMENLQHIHNESK